MLVALRFTGIGDLFVRRPSQTMPLPSQKADWVFDEPKNVVTITTRNHNTKG